jgi:D-amino-acid oxidase
MQKNVYHTVRSLIISCLVAHLSYTSPIEVRRITPPCLDEEHLGKKIICYRPMRRGSPDMSVKKVVTGTGTEDFKIVATNAGHGGSGWTLGPGCAQYVITMLTTSPDAADLTKDTPITIIGAGALGLFSAYVLLLQGFTNITIIAQDMENLTSHNAGGLLAPVSMDNDPVMQKIINQIGIEAYKFYAAIAHNESDPVFSGGAIIVPTYFPNREESGLEPYVGIVMQEAKDVLLDFGNGTTQCMVVYDDGIFINTAKMMAALHTAVAPYVTFIERIVYNFAEVDTKYIINCTGLGAQELNNDPNYVSVQGHLVMLKDQNPADLNYMILVYFGKTKTKYHQEVKRSFYIFPKQLPDSEPNDIGVIGGTFIEGGTKNTPNEEEFAILIDQARTFYGLAI